MKKRTSKCDLPLHLILIHSIDQNIVEADNNAEYIHSLRQLYKQLMFQCLKSQLINEYRIKESGLQRIFQINLMRRLVPASKIKKGNLISLTLPLMKNNQHK